MRSHGIISSLILLAPLTSAWQPLEAAAAQLAPLFARQKSTTSFELHPTNKEGNTATTVSSASATVSVSGASSSADKGKTSAKDGSTVASSSNTKSGDTSTYDTTKTFAITYQPGGVSMVTPNPISDPFQYYRISESITFAWEYTSVKATPRSVNVLASCSTNSATYTIATNVPVVTNGTQTVVWDTQDFIGEATRALVMGTYTLVVYDAAKAVTAMPEPGYLNTFNQFFFGMYPGEPYQPTARFLCATCSAGSSMFERHTVPFIFGMAAMTVLSFGWFGGVAGLW